ncbi:hypothetical protein [Flavobacterium sp.]|uniref:hypothetical protein n=1 Tax=Flavobacterium sp. TaxID=239 RepID=UPI0035AF26FE
MLLTKQKNRKQIDSLKMDLEIINPIESKKVLGGDWYFEDPPAGYIWEQSAYAWNNYHADQGGQDYGGWWDDALGGNYNDPGSWDNNGGGGSPDGSPNPTFPDHICKQQLSSSMDCTPIVMSYVANYFGATGLTSSDFAEMVGQNYQFMSAGYGGFSDADINTVLSSVFQSTTIDNSLSSIAAQVNSGNPIIAGFDNPNGTSHEVVITNVENNVITYMDPGIGDKVSVDYKSGMFFELYAISGVQNNNLVNQYKNDTNDISFCPICGH